MSISKRVRQTLMKPAVAAVSLGLACAATPALALQPPALGIGPGHWWIGLGFLRYQRPYVGDSRWSRFVPLLSINTSHFYVHGMKFGWRAWREGNSTFELVARPDALHYNPVANGALTGMSTKLASVMGGAAWVWHFYDHLSLDTQALTDLLRRSDGDIVSVAVAGRWCAGRWFFQPQAGLAWQSANYVNYYFGVTPTEERPGRPAYTGTSTINESASFVVGRNFAGHFAALVGAYATHFGSGITASPIVAHKNTLSLLFGIYYHF